MKKIMFNDKYGLTQAVLEGRKTQTRRIAYISRYEFEVANYEYPSAPLDLRKSILNRSKYKINEIVAIAQSYKDCGYDENALDISPKDYRISRGTLGNSKGWSNKMFVRADACKHQIRITNVRIERLQDISDEDCLKEGVRLIKENIISQSLGFEGKYEIVGDFPIYDTPQEAYAHLIDKINGKGTWESNPYVFVYDFELVK